MEAFIEKFSRKYNLPAADCFCGPTRSAMRPFVEKTLV